MIVKFTAPIIAIAIITFFLYLEKQIALNKEKIANDMEELYQFILKTQEKLK
jgi:hypothetical protein